MMLRSRTGLATARRAHALGPAASWCQGGPIAGTLGNVSAPPTPNEATPSLIHGTPSPHARQSTAATCRRPSVCRRQAEPRRIIHERYAVSAVDVSYCLLPERARQGRRARSL